MPQTYIHTVKRKDVKEETITIYKAKCPECEDDIVLDEFNKYDEVISCPYCYEEIMLED